MSTFEANVRSGGNPAIREASRFFIKSDPVYDSLRGITDRLASLNLPYAIVGGMALVAHGYRRTTEHVEVLVTADGLKTIHDSLTGLGYRPVFEKSKNLRDVDTGVRIEFIVTGQYPGDGKPKPVAFPDPSKVSLEIDNIRYANLPTLVELKLASGMTNPGRLRDLADVQELIRVLQLPDSFVQQLAPYVHDKFVELAEAIKHGGDNEDE